MPLTGAITGQSLQVQQRGCRHLGCIRRQQYRATPLYTWSLPCSSSPANPEAAQLYLNDRPAYKKCVGRGLWGGGYAANARCGAWGVGYGVRGVW